MSNRRQLRAGQRLREHQGGDADGLGFVRGAISAILLLLAIAITIWLTVQILDSIDRIGAISATLAQVQAPGFSAEAAMAGAAP